VSKAFISAACMTKIGRHFKLGIKNLIHEVTACMEEKTGSRPDYLIVASALSALQTHQLDIASITTQYLGWNNIPSMRVETGETSGIAALELAQYIVRSGAASKVLVIGVEKMTEYPSNKVNADYAKILDYDTEYVRNITPPNYAALVMKEYMRKYGVTRDDVAEWPVRMHANAVSNPYAQLRFPVSKEGVRNAMVISEPITLLDAFPIGDGAAAVLVTDESARGKDAVEVVAITSASAPSLYLRDDMTELPATKAAWASLRRKLEAQRLDEVALQVHDSYSIYGILALETLGVSDRGKACSIIPSLEYLNVGGGLKARGHPIGATGLYQVAETYELMIEGFAGKQYSGEYALIHSMSGPDYNARLALLRRW